MKVKLRIKPNFDRASEGWQEYATMDSPLGNLTVSLLREKAVTLRTKVAETGGLIGTIDTSVAGPPTSTSRTVTASIDDEEFIFTRHPGLMRSHRRMSVSSADSKYTIRVKGLVVCRGRIERADGSCFCEFDGSGGEIDDSASPVEVIIAALSLATSMERKLIIVHL